MERYGGRKKPRSKNAFNLNHRYKNKTGLAPAALMALPDESLPSSSGSSILQSIVS